MIIVIAKDEAEARELRAIVGAEVVTGRVRAQRPSLAVYTIGQRFGVRADRVWVRQETMKAITASPTKWAWWCEAVMTRLPPLTRPEYI